MHRQSRFRAAATVTTLATAAQPLFSPSSRTIGWLLDNLVQFSQGQTAEILPLGKNEMAAVAVLLSASNLSLGHDERTMVPSPIPTEDDNAIDFSNIPSEDGRTDPSPLDRFVANLGDASFDLSSESADRRTRQTAISPDWVWRLRTADPNAITVTFDNQIAGQERPRPIGLDNDLAGFDPASLIALDRSDGVSTPSEATISPWWAIAIGSTITMVTAVIAARRRDLIRLVTLWKRKVRTTAEPAEPNSTQRNLPGRSIAPGHATRLRQDLPPWLQEPMAIKRRPSLMSRSIISTFSKRSLQPRSPSNFTKPPL
jgi:hypothetical protein